LLCSSSHSRQFILGVMLGREVSAITPISTPVVHTRAREQTHSGSEFRQWVKMFFPVSHSGPP
jgi:hypothetical protein